MGACVSTGTVVGSGRPTNSSLHTPVKSSSRRFSTSSPEKHTFDHYRRSASVGSKLAGWDQLPTKNAGEKNPREAPPPPPPQPAADIGFSGIPSRTWRNRSLSGDFFGLREYLTRGGPPPEKSSSSSPVSAGGQKLKKRSASVGGGDAFWGASSGERVRWRLPAPPGASGKESLENPLVSLECFIFL